MRRLSALWFSKSAGESSSGGRHWDMGVGWDEGYWCTALEVTSFSITELWILRSKGLHLSVLSRTECFIVKQSFMNNAITHCLEYWNVIALDLVAFPKRTGLWPLALRGMWAKLYLIVGSPDHQHVQEKHTLQVKHHFIERRLQPKRPRWCPDWSSFSPVQFASIFIDVAWLTARHINLNSR